MYADMAELADALDSGSSEVTLIQVQVLLSAPQKESFNRKVGAFLFVSAGTLPPTKHTNIIDNREALW